MREERKELHAGQEGKGKHACKEGWKRRKEGKDKERSFTLIYSTDYYE